jgi:hypothetical protein
VAEELRKELGVPVDLVNGSRGEFTVLVDDRPVARKWLIFKPSVEKVLKAVREAMPAQAK